MTNYSDAKLREIRLIDALVREEMRRQGLPVDNRLLDELLASGTLKAAEGHVRSKDMVTPGWLERATRNSRDRS